MKSSLLLLPSSPSLPWLLRRRPRRRRSRGSAPAEVKSDWSVTGNAGLFSDYRFRGISQTDKKPAFQGGFDIGHASGFYVGNWNSNIDSALLQRRQHRDGFLRRLQVAGSAHVALDFGVLYYYYPGSGAGGTSKIDNTELYVSAGFGPVSAKYSQAVSDFFGVARFEGLVVPRGQRQLRGHDRLLDRSATSATRS